MLYSLFYLFLMFFFFFFNDTATTEIYTLSLHDALPIFRGPTEKHRIEQPKERACFSSRCFRQGGHRLAVLRHRSSAQLPWQRPMLREWWGAGSHGIPGQYSEPSRWRPRGRHKNGRGGSGRVGTAWRNESFDFHASHSDLREEPRGFGPSRSRCRWRHEPASGFGL